MTSVRLRVGRLQDIRLVEVMALLMFWVLVFHLKDITEQDQSESSRSQPVTGRQTRHPHLWAEFTKTHVV